MARIRSIHPGLFTDEAFVSLSPLARLLWMGIWTECDDHGVFEWKPVTLKMRLLPVDNVEVNDLLSELEAKLCVLPVVIGKAKVGLVRNFCKYQRPKFPKYKHTIDDPLWLSWVGITPSVTEIEGVEPPPFPQKEETAPQREMERREVGEEKKESGPKRVRTKYSDDFEVEFWKPYPRTPIMSKVQAFGEWKKLSEEDRKAASAAIPGFKAYCREHPNYQPVHACRFLSDRRFDGFAPDLTREGAAAAPTHGDTLPDGQVYLRAETHEYDAWTDYMRKNGEKHPPRWFHGGWKFASRWPPGAVREHSEAAE